MKNVSSFDTRKSSCRHFYTTIGVLPYGVDLPGSTGYDYARENPRFVIPALPHRVAIFCCVINFLLPGIGTILAAFLAICFEDSLHLSNMHRTYRFFRTCATGLLQLLFALCFFIGWLWSCLWGVAFIAASDHETNRRKIIEEDITEEQRISAFAISGTVEQPKINTPASKVSFAADSTRRKVTFDLSQVNEILGRRVAVVGTPRRESEVDDLNLTITSLSDSIRTRAILHTVSESRTNSSESVSETVASVSTPMAERNAGWPLSPRIAFAKTCAPNMAAVPMSSRMRAIGSPTLEDFLEAGPSTGKTSIHKIERLMWNDTGSE